MQESNACLYKWRAKYRGMKASLIKLMKSIDAANRRLKQVYAEAQMPPDVLKEAPEKSD